MLAFQSRDFDFDTHFVNETGEVCAGNGLTVQYAAAPVVGEPDCMDGDILRFQLLDYVARDADFDRHSIASAGRVCSGSNLPAGYFAVAAVPPEDCNDDNSSMWRLMTVWADADGDAVGAGRGTVTCVGNAAAAGFSLLGYDPLDDPANPGSPGISTAELAAWQLTPRL